MKKIIEFDKFFLESEDEKKEFKFEELSPEAKETAIENCRYVNVEYEDWDAPVIEEFEEDMEEVGVTGVIVNWTGFRSQGDGASFVGQVEDVEKFLKEALGMSSDEFLDLGDEDDKYDGDEDLRDLISSMREIGFSEKKKITPEDIYITIERESSRYYHENTIYARVEIDEPSERDDDRDWNSFVSELEKKCTDWAREISKELYGKLNSAYEDLISDEEVIETIKANDWTFKEDGKN